MNRKSWSDGHMTSVAVNGGVVELDGHLFDVRQREALGVLAENVPGVKNVENRIVCTEPTMGMVTYDPDAC